MAEQEVYQAAMNEAANAAWEEDWERAARAYQRALKAKTNDAQALAGLALAFLEAGEYEKALPTYQRVSKIVPGDPLPHEKMGEIYQAQGDFKQAAKQFHKAGEIYFGRKDLKRALPNWELAARLDRELPQAHMRLAVNYERNKDLTTYAIHEYLHVARLLQQAGQARRAEQALSRAQNIDPINSEIRNALDDLRRGNPINITTTYEDLDEEGQLPSDQTDHDAEPVDEDLFAFEEEEEERSLIDETAREALGLLADIIWTGDVPPQAQTPLLQGIDAHQVGDVTAAIENYQQVLEAGLTHPALYFSMGVLLHYDQQYEAAVEVLNLSTGAQDYAAPSHLMICQAYAEMNDPLHAAEHTLKALRSVDRQINTGAVDEQGYQRVLDSLGQQSPEQLMELNESLTNYLEGPNWKSKLRETLTKYQDEGRSNYVSALVDVMIEGGQPEVSDMMTRVDQYMQSNILHLAIEELHYAIGRAPDYLPAHRRLADLLIREGRTQEAATKINIVANTYLIRGNEEKAADLFSQVIDMWPADTGARRRVIDMMRQQGRVGEAMHHYVEMADLHFRLMADPDKAIEVYNEALGYAQKANAQPQHVLPVLKALSDIESQRLNWRKALSYLEQARRLDPNDAEAALSVVDLYFQLGDSNQAIKALDDYIRQRIRGGDIESVTKTLEDQVRRHPEEIPLRQRLAEVYRQQDRQQEAITQMDALGELQLDAGQLDKATATIRKIVEMNPPDVEGYRQLLEQLESGNV